VLSNKQINELARVLYNAEVNKISVSPLTNQFPELTFNEAYQIQDELLNLQLKSGRAQLGYKIGLTNFDKMKERNLNFPLRGNLLSDMILSNNSTISSKKLIQPRVEAEVAFVLAHDLSGVNITANDVIAATDYIVAAIEIVDSRYHDFKCNFNDTIADNICAAMVVLGDNKIKPSSISLVNINVEVKINGRLTKAGNSSIVLGNPLNSVAMLANMLSIDGRVLKAGSLIMSGMITEAIPIHAGDRVEALFHGFGSASVPLVD
jgi:2-oxo-3-hexenedioate decarboxylase